MTRFVGLHLFDDAETGSRRLRAVLRQGVVELKPAERDYRRKPGFYSFNWRRRRQQPADTDAGKER